jgi:hypothetical protein
MNSAASATMTTSNQRANRVVALELDAVEIVRLALSPVRGGDILDDALHSAAGCAQEQASFSR